MVPDSASSFIQADLLRLVALILAVAIVAGCSDGGEDISDASQGEPASLLCTEPAGSWTDLTGEDPNWRAGEIAVDWTDEARCAVRLDTIWHRFGDEHCGSEETERISIGLPIGTPYTGPTAQPPGQNWEPFFFFNTDGVFEGLPPGELLDAADIPVSAIDTGLRAVTGRRLLIAADSTALYDVQGTAARVFVRASDDETSCA